jgi:tetratricopeptide (TPR) repeat protein
MNQPLVCSSRSARRTMLTRLLLCLFITGCALATPRPAPAAFQSSSDAEQEDRFNQAVQAYNQNRFTDARTLFEGVKGSHSQEAKKYLDNIQAYRSALTDADSFMNKSSDELDAGNVDFAIKRYQDAIAIKSDGPWSPKEKLQKALDLKARLVQQSRPGTQSRDRGLCDNLLKAIAAKSYEQAKLAACAISHDDPGYSCGGDEALHLCQQMGELATLHPHSRPAPENAPGAAAPTNPVEGSKTSALEKAKAAFDANDFEKARIAFQQVTGEDKASAQDYIIKISQYQDAMKRAAKSANNSQYEEARAAYQEAAKIKPDGPGSPQEQAGSMALQQALTQFYAGNYGNAHESLAAYVQDYTTKANLAHFYMGACELSRFFLAGSQDGSLREEALNDFRKAKEAGFEPKNLEVSPKILKVYEELGN